jgi:uncharacterized membrane protein YccF (DUF307 family)
MSSRLHPISAAWALAAAASSAVLAWRSRLDTGRPSAGMNAVSHWVWPEKALRVNEPSLRYTGTGAVVHVMSSLLWAALYGWWLEAGGRRSVADAAAKAAAVTSVAALVDLKLVPERLTPGFERRLSTRSVALVYASFGAGLLAGALALRDR